MLMITTKIQFMVLTTPNQTQSIFNFSPFDIITNNAGFGPFTIYGMLFQFRWFFSGQIYIHLQNFAISSIIYLKCEAVCCLQTWYCIEYIERSKFSCYVSNTMIQPCTTIYFELFFSPHFDFLHFANNKPVNKYVVELVLSPLFTTLWGKNNLFLWLFIRTKWVWALFSMNHNLF